MKLRFVSSLAPRFVLLVFAAAVLAGCTNSFNQPSATPTPAPTENLPLPELTTDADGVLEMPVPAGIDPVIAKMTFDHSWMLSDSQGGDAVGLVTSTFSDKFYLQADAQNLPPLAENHFYEGWLVRSLPPSVISTGSFVETPEGWFNQFTSEADLTSYGEYVVTIEPSDDGANGEPDPAPTTIHVLEGKSN